jgi:hypothetical protein
MTSSITHMAGDAINVSRGNSGKRVLLGHVERGEYLLGFLEYAQRQLGWTIGIVTSHRYPAFEEGPVIAEEDHFWLPDQMLTAGSDIETVDADLRKLVAACERRTGIPLNRIALADARHAGRGYTRESFYRESSARATLALRDNGYAERYLLSLVRTVEVVLDQFKPDLIVSGHLASPPIFAAAMLARARDIPVLSLRSSKILSHRSFWTLDWGMLNTLGAEVCTKKIEQMIVPGPVAFEYLQRFREEPKVVAYIRRNWTRSAARTTLWAGARDVVKRSLASAKWLLGGRRGVWGKSPIAKSGTVLRTALLKARQNDLFKSFTEEELAATRYIFIALHKEPELATTYQAPLWHNQKNLIAWLSMNLPCGYRLLVRDHRRNEGRRPTAYYRTIKAYPGVDLVSPFDSQFKYIRNAALIVADNGSTGWEGLIFGKRVISLARNFYEPAGLAESVTDPSRLGEAIIRCLGRPETADRAEWDRRLACLIEAELETTVVDDSTSYAQSLEILTSLTSTTTLGLAEVNG